MEYVGLAWVSIKCFNSIGAFFERLMSQTNFESFLKVQVWIESRPYSWRNLFRLAMSFTSYLNLNSLHRMFAYLLASGHLRLHPYVSTHVHLIKILNEEQPQRKMSSNLSNLNNVKQYFVSTTAIAMGEY